MLRGREVVKAAFGAALVVGLPLVAYLLCWLEVGAALQLFAALATCAFAGLTWWVYVQIREVMAKTNDLADLSNAIAKQTNEISERSVEELRRTREMEHMPLLQVTVEGYSLFAGGLLKFPFKVKNVGRGVAINLMCVGPDRSTGMRETMIDQRSSGVQEWDIRVEALAREPVVAPERVVRLRYKDLLGNKWETRLVGEDLETVRLDPSETW